MDDSAISTKKGFVQRHCRRDGSVGLGKLGETVAETDRQIKTRGCEYSTDSDKENWLDQKHHRKDTFKANTQKEVIQIMSRACGTDLGNTTTHGLGLLQFRVNFWIYDPFFFGISLSSLDEWSAPSQGLYLQGTAGYQKKRNTRVPRVGFELGWLTVPEIKVLSCIPESIPNVPEIIYFFWNV
jgi:hypothetical protein